MVRCLSVCPSNTSIHSSIHPSIYSLIHPSIYPVPCSDNCLLCAVNAGECTQCDSDYSLGNNGQCISNNLPISILICKSIHVMTSLL